MRLSRRALLAGASCAILAHDANADGPLDSLLARIAAARAQVRTLQGPFTQTRRIGLLSTDVRSTGTVTLVRPERLRWELAPPDDVTFWVTPEGLSYRSARGEGRMPAASARLGGALDDLRTLLGGDLARLRERWDLRVLRDDASGAELEATPRPGAGGALRSLRMALAADLARPSRAVLAEGARDMTTIEFGALVINAPVDDARMHPPR
jgi:Outer membrane lipoprotein carrier protein LolA